MKRIKKVLTQEEIDLIDKYFRATNYLSAAQLYLLDNPLLQEELKIEHIKPKIVGHWGTTPGQNFIYTHLNRVIKKYNLDMMYVAGPGHGGQAAVTNVYLEGTYSQVYPNVSLDLEGLKRLCKQFSFPGGISSHVAPETPGSINEGGELGYSLAHSYGAVLDNPNLIVACCVGDGEAETGPLATSWHINKFINPKTDGAVLPILHLNGYKIANPSILARISKLELTSYFQGCGYQPIIVEGSNPKIMHQKMACALEECILEIKNIQKLARQKNYQDRPLWPMIILKTPKGWTGPKIFEEKQIEGSFRAHQVPITIDPTTPKNIKLLEKWLKSYHPEDLFTSEGKLIPELKSLIPPKGKRMGENIHANGGLLYQPLRTPNFKDYGIDVIKGKTESSDMMELGRYIRDVIKLNEANKNFRIFGPDEALSNRLNHIFEVTNRQFDGKTLISDEYLEPSGRVIDSYLSEHVCQGLLEGYLLTGRHGFMHSYEAFVRIVDSMASQHAKWLKVCNELEWRADIASLNYIISSHVWQQDHNGYTHQDPGFLNHLVTKKADTVRMYLPPDTNCLLSCFDHIIKSKNYINVIVASKHPTKQWLTMDEAVKHCTKGIGVWDFASNDQGKEPDLIMACCGDTPTLETLAAVTILREHFKTLKVRVVNVVDLMRLQSDLTHPHGLTDEEYDSLFTKDKPIIFNFHGYPSLIHQLTYKRHNQELHVHGYIEEGTITTAFDMRVQNKIDRYNLVLDALKYLPKLGDKRTEVEELCKNKLIEHKEYIHEYGTDLDEIKNWEWNL